MRIDQIGQQCGVTGPLDIQSCGIFRIVNGKIRTSWGSTGKRHKDRFFVGIFVVSI